MRWPIKDDFVCPFAAELVRIGLRVWYDEWTLKIGDGMRQEIDYGLAARWKTAANAAFRRIQAFVQ
ncbi:MAG TPA: hypothetical protein VNN22_18145 [Verrucomicrobiae bacterium]|nr:hypothetical protein [Verrucomicrobiae bacterium]